MSLHAEYVCDWCRRAIRVHPVAPGARQFLPPPEWLEVELAKGGTLDACSEPCAEKIATGAEV